MFSSIKNVIFFHSIEFNIRLTVTREPLFTGAVVVRKHQKTKKGKSNENNQDSTCFIIIINIDF